MMADDPAPVNAARIDIHHILVLLLVDWASDNVVSWRMTVSSIFSTLAAMESTFDSTRVTSR